MQDIIIDEEFKFLLPPLDKTTYTQLEENILQHGCREPLVLWEGILIDGHNRYEISKKHDIPFKTVNMEFDSRENVIIWMISTQVLRRNLTPTQLTFFRGLHYITDKKVHGDINRIAPKSASDHSEHLGELGSTAMRLADEYNVSPITIRRDAQAAAGIIAIGKTSPEAKRNILSEKTKISRKKLRELSAGPDEDIIEVAKEIDNGTFGKNNSLAPRPDENHPSTDFIPPELLQLERDLKRLTTDFHTEIHGLIRNSDTNALRVAFKSYVATMEDMLEGIYN